MFTSKITKILQGFTYCCFAIKNGDFTQTKCAISVQ